MHPLLRCREVSILSLREPRHLGPRATTRRRTADRGRDVEWTALCYGLTSGVTLGYFHNVGLCISRDGCDFHQDFLDLPVQIQYQLTDQNALLLTTRMHGPLSDFGGSFAVPVGLGTLATLSRRVDVGGELLFTNLAGRGGGVDGRLLLLRVAFRP
jgi:hypothetical protein